LIAIRPMRLRHSRKVGLASGLALMAVYLAALVNNRFDVLDLEGKEMSSPAGSAFQIALALQIAEETKELARQHNQNSFGASPARSNDNEVYVWIIGESSRPQNWSLFGYQRDTTPRLRSTHGVFPLPNMLTTAPVTAVAVPSMLSLQPITDWNSVLAQRSIVSAFNEAGFTTYWLSCQEADVSAGSIPIVAAESMRRSYSSRAFDGELLEKFRNALAVATPGQKLFFVLHTKGSHFEYSRRYPAAFMRFSASGGTYREQLVDSYDNSVLYTDWIVSEVIATLAKSGFASALIYSSDHGENLLDNDTQLLGHAIGNQYDLPTAAFIWLSDSLRAMLPKAAENLAAHASAKLSLSNLPHSLLDLAGIAAPTLDRSSSVFDQHFREKARWYVVRGKLFEEQKGLYTDDRNDVATAEHRLPPMFQLREFVVYWLTRCFRATASIRPASIRQQE
jgi:glucan phosphoethanolaminetransferase (alkaline phosphatase superfamily)